MSSAIPLVPPRVGPTKGPHPVHPFQPLPAPTGSAPFRLDLAEVIGAEGSAQTAEKLVFQAVGDVGGIKSPEKQQLVAMYLEREVRTAQSADAPRFLYLLGDVIYYNGFRVDYYSQFYEPYQSYPVPIVAVPGNHDGDTVVDPTDQPDPEHEASLAAFVRNFCAPSPIRLPEAEDIQRDAMIQPNVYWTLTAPRATVVGLYTNVPEYGVVEDDQRAWFVGELEQAATDRALIVVLHHPPFSEDKYMSASEPMRRLLEDAFQEAKRWPDLVLSGHVHSYQRFTFEQDGRSLTYVVAGAGGYWHLHDMRSQSDGTALTAPSPGTVDGSTLEAFVADRWGFLTLSITAQTIEGTYTVVPRPAESWHHGPPEWADAVQVADSFTIQLQ